MKKEEHFLFQPGEWLGAGQVSFSMSPDVLHFRTRWQISPPDEGAVSCTQTVEIVGGDRLVNMFEIVPEDNADRFHVVLENDELGTFEGSGLFDEKMVAWEFRDKGVFEGFEVYKRVEDDEYTMHAEYVSSDQTRTMIRGRIWRRAHYRDKP